jgi:hypothetical protein
MMAEFAGFGPVTIELTQQYVENRLLPWADIRRSTTRTTLAIRSDGSRAVHAQRQGYHHYAIEIPEERSQGAVIVDLAARTVTNTWSNAISSALHACPWPTAWAKHPPPRTCQGEVKGAEKTGESKHSGFHVEIWDGYRVRYWLAPELYCAPLRRESQQGSGWLPDWYSVTEVTHLRLGEPAPALFRLER